VALALYRTYRPGSLAEVIGQEHVTEPLGRALEAGRTHHAYLFSGPRGCGKTSTARILARSLNCAQGPTAQPCGTCRSCVELAPNGPGSIDVIEMDAATHRGIDDARDLREKAIYAPAASRFKIYIIDEAHQLTNEAANALLKLVEEPPPHLRFIFATTEPDKIIPTIRSRTFHYGFRLVPARVLAEHLASVCRSEGVPAEGPALAVVARAGAGSVRDSLSVLGQLLAGAGADGLTYADAVSALGLTDSTLIDAFVEALANGSAAAMFTVVDSVISAGHDPRRFITDVLDRLRDLIILRADPEALASGLVDVPDDAGDRMLAQSKSLGLAELSRAADLVSVGLGEVKGATAPRLQLELLCARLALPAPGDDLASLLARMERLERGIGTSTAAPTGGGRPSAPSAPVGASAPKAPAPATADARPNPPRRPELRTDARSATATSPATGVGVVAASPTAASSGPEPATDSAAPAADAGSQGARGPVPDQVPGDAHPDVGDSQVSQVRSAWPAILTQLAGDSRVAWTAFHAATPVSVSQGVLAVAVAEPGNVRAIAARGHDERLRQAIIDVLSLDLSIDVLHDPGAAAVTGSAGVAGSGRSGGPAPAPGPPGPARAGSGSRQLPRDTGTAQTPGSPDAAGGDSSQSAHASEPAAARSGPSRQAAASSAATRGADLIRAAAAGTAAAEDQPDEPSEDDPDLSGADGLALITRELGARPIGEIDHS
jgi:DNA polymerase-3 subunit gamma/tau